MPRDLPIGNGSLLINFDSTGQIRDIYWPFVGQAPHIAGPAPCHLRSHDPRLLHRAAQLETQLNT